MVSALLHSEALLLSFFHLPSAGEVMLGDLYRSGFEITDAHEEADAIVINTCGFVEDAKTESIEVLLF